MFVLSPKHAFLCVQTLLCLNCVAVLGQRSGRLRQSSREQFARGIGSLADIYCAYCQRYGWIECIRRFCYRSFQFGLGSPGRRVMGLDAGSSFGPSFTSRGQWPFSPGLTTGGVRPFARRRGRGVLTRGPFGPYYQ